MTPWQTTIRIKSSISEDAAFDLLDALSTRGAAISFGTPVMVISMTGYGDDAGAGAREAIRTLKTLHPAADVIDAQAQSYEELEKDESHSSRTT